jgi:predicted ATP-grasp superfamily ATP-dependent carboligase
MWFFPPVTPKLGLLTDEKVPKTIENTRTGITKPALGAGGRVFESHRPDQPSSTTLSLLS